jgi:hypothetical protein
MRLGRCSRDLTLSLQGHRPPDPYHYERSPILRPLSRRKFGLPDFWLFGMRNVHVRLFSQRALRRNAVLGCPLAGMIDRGLRTDLCCYGVSFRSPQHLISPSLAVIGRGRRAITWGLLGDSLGCAPASP